MYGSWAYTRCIILPIYIYNIIQHCRYPEDRIEFQPIIYYEVSFLGLLQVLHLYWFVLLSRVGLGLLREGQRIQANIGPERPVIRRGQEETKRD